MTQNQESGASVIAAYNLAKTFNGTVALRDVNFEVKAGEIFGLLGPNGAGKTTTVRLLACLYQPTGGSGQVLGMDITAPGNAERIREHIGLLTESPGLYDRLNALEYLGFFGELYGMSAADIRASSERLLKMMGIWERRNDRLARFSKGMKQKIAIARTLIHGPQVIFLDEPTSGLDPESAKVVRDYVLELRAEKRRTFVLCTHNLPEAERLCDRIALINQGRVVAQGSADELRARLAGGKERLCKIHVAARAAESAEVVKAFAAKHPEVTGVQQAGDVITYTTTDPEALNPLLLQEVLAAGGRVVALNEEEQSLENVYLELMRDSREEE
ncbi:MAG TPA: ABC transporter ATP-binding protein [Bacillota bacterium]|jgi:ABC-2 type transport system ATP-binding protein